MKKWISFRKILLSAILVFNLTGCANLLDKLNPEKDGEKENDCPELTGNQEVDKLLSSFKYGSYTGKLSKIKLSKGAAGNLIVTWAKPENDKRFKAVNIYLNGVRTPVCHWMPDDNAPSMSVLTGGGDDDTCKAVIDGLEEKRYTVCVIALGSDENGDEIYSKNYWWGTINLGRSKLTKYKFIGRGYDALSSEYFSEKGLKEAIIDFDDTYFPQNEKMNSSDVIYSAGTTIKEYKESFNESVGLGVKFGGFRGGVSVDFDKSSAESEETAFASAYGNYLKDREYLTSGQKKLNVLKLHLNTDFVNDLNDDSVTPEKLFDTYGTHVMLDTYIGGRFVMNYTFNKKSTMTAQSIEVGVKASYSAVSASSTTGTSSETSEMIAKSNITGYARGGKSVSFSDERTAKVAWSDWTNYLDSNSESWSLVDSPQTIKYEFDNTGIWLFALDESRRNEIKSYYDEQLENNRNAIASMCKPTLIKDVKIFFSHESWDGVYKAIRNFEGHENFRLVGYDAANKRGISYYNLQRDSDNKKTHTLDTEVYLYYTTTKNEAEAIKGCVGSSAKTYAEATYIRTRYPNLDPNQWTVSSGDYRDGCGGDKWAYFLTSKTQGRNGKTGDEAPYIREIDLLMEDGSSTVSQKALDCYTVETSTIDITKDTGGDNIYLYLYY